MQILDCTKIEQVVGGQSAQSHLEDCDFEVRKELSEWGMYIISVEYATRRDKKYA